MAYSDVVLGLSPAAYWRFGEASGTSANDETANNYDATYSNITLGDTGLVVDDANKGVHATNTSGNVYTTAATAAALLGGVGKHPSFTFSGLIKLTSAPTTAGRLFSRQYGSGLYITSARKLCFTYRNSSNTSRGITTSTLTVPTGEACHIALTYTYDTNTVKIYLNGECETLTLTSPDAYVYTGHSGYFCLYLASEESQTYAPAGTFDEFAFFTSALSQENVTTLYSQALDPPTGEAEFTITAAAASSLSGSPCIEERDLTCSGAATLAFEQAQTNEGYTAIVCGSTVNFLNAFGEVWTTDVAGVASVAFVGEDNQDAEFTIASVGLFSGYLSPQVVEATFTGAAVGLAEFIPPDYQDRDFTCLGAGLAVPGMAVSPGADFVGNGRASTGFLAEAPTDLICFGYGRARTSFISQPTQSTDIVVTGSAISAWASALSPSAAFSASAAGSTSLQGALDALTTTALSGEAAASFSGDLLVEGAHSGAGSSSFAPALEVFTATARKRWSNPDIFIKTERLS